MRNRKLLRLAFRLMMTSSFVMGLFLLAPLRAQAGILTVSLSPLANPGAGSTANSFDVLLTNSSATDVSIAAFFFEVLSSSPDIAFTDATTATGTAYIFGADSLFGPDIIGAGSTSTDLNASDLDAAGSAVLAPGATVALGHVLFDVSANAPTQIVTFSLAGFPGTSFSDELGNDVAVADLLAGRFEIEGAVAQVPEPSTLLLLLPVLGLALRKFGPCGRPDQDRR